ncbi:nickel pincer cofactor biosynthesis protein LarC [Myxosarcina sp. GI1]|uniref:nickel pincer cofactor biosynthesis protein LarC n=1 Tax=Myxosarcina sp. GI1 TaxID=1541065 RepID=UPI000568E632|nr:nickel pincer cofactor biosynthesis protein LarC [Myxosarcina sp. GI1]
MSKVGYLECPTGIAGDMCLGALVDLGVPWEYLCDRLASLGIEREYQLKQEKVNRNGQLATKVWVDLLEPHHHQHGRHLPQIEQIITSATISDRAKDWSLQVFRNLAIAEAAVHGIPPEKVHFHEVGATDAIIDIVGTCLGLDWLGIDKLYCSPMPTGGGIVKAAHGKLPVPVPAVVKLWETREVPVYSNGIEKELVTPTGAAIATTLATSFGSPPTMRLEKIGLGAGLRDLAIPNILRLWLGTTSSNDTSAMPVDRLPKETITVLETQIDDLSPQAIAYTSEKLLQTGALDVFTQAIAMKKSRVGILLTVICHPELVATCKTVIFRETTTLGIRETTQTRSILNREIETVETKYGAVKIKVASWGEGNAKEIVNIHPEYEDCAALAKKNAISWQEIHQQAIALWQNNRYRS